ncbi:MAG: Gfo/Idh/MocA family oxidoreductase [Bauldia sp.]
MQPMGIGLIGAGNISSQYLKAAPSFPILAVKGIADINMDAAKARAAEFGVPAKSVAELLADPEVDIVVNLTVPKAHVEVGLKAIAAGKHVHSEKPLGVTVAEGRKLIDAAKAKGVRVGGAPDTFMGGAHQTCRKLIDEGAIGQVITGIAFFGTPGHERWHPSPAFYYLQGGGPVLDMGPYYITALVNLLGPVKRVAAITSKARSERPITSEPLKGQMMPVEVATHAAATLEFWSGAIVTVVLSFDIPRYRHAPIELYGLTGTLGVPDPNWMDGEILIATADQDWKPVPIQHGHAEHNLRIMAVADMATAIRNGRPHRASGDLAFHVLEVMEAFQRSSDEKRHIEMTTRPERPAMMPTYLKTGEFD